jgi:hypothetical protein
VIIRIYLNLLLIFYKELYRKEGRGEFSLRNDFWEPSEKLTQGECEALEPPSVRKE